MLAGLTRDRTPDDQAVEAWRARMETKRAENHARQAAEDAAAASQHNKNKVREARELLDRIDGVRREPKATASRARKPRPPRTASERKPRPTPVRDLFVTLARQGLTAPEIAAKTGHAKGTVYNQLAIAGVKPAPIKNRVDTDTITTLYTEGRSLSEIATHVGCARSTVLYHLKRAGIVTRPAGWTGEVTCGTNSGAVTHYRNGEKPCDECRKASAEYQRQRRARRKEPA